MRLLWLDIDDAPGANSLRGLVERNVIGLLSNYDKPPVDPPSPDWLGHASARDKVRKSGLWNQNHVGDAYDPGILMTLEKLVSAVGAGA